MSELIQIQYCLGLPFNVDRDRVLLINKERPDWQRGKLNGVGGQRREDETYLQSMRRECLEETGCDIPESDWNFVLDMEFPQALIKVYSAFTDEVYKAEQVTDEKPELMPITWLTTKRFLHNLQWIIPLCLDEYLINEKAIIYFKNPF